MPKFVSLVFKILILTIFITTAVTLATSVIDVFVSYSRINSITEYIEYDIAQNNCMLNDTYNSYVNLLEGVTDRSSCLYWRNGESGHVVELYTGDNAAAIPTCNYIQKNSDAVGQIPAEGFEDRAINHDTTFYVAQYGDILHLRLNAGVQIRFFGGSSADSKVIDAATDQHATTIGGLSWKNLTAVPMTFKYDIPALTYLK